MYTPPELIWVGKTGGGEWPKLAVTDGNVTIQINQNGTYTFQVTIKDPQTGKSVTKNVDISVQTQPL